MNPFCLAAVSPLLLCAFADLGSAQELLPPAQRPQVRGGTGHQPVERVVHVVYDAQAGRVRSVRSSGANEIGFGSPPCYDNSDIFLPLDPQYIVANPGEDLLNWGTKNCPGASRLRSFTFAYRSEADDVSIGGPGAAFSIALYTGTIGFGAPGSEVFRATFTGQPSNGAPASGTVVYDDNGTPFQTGPAPLVYFTVDFGTEPLPLNDGAFGWSFLQLDGDTGPVMVRAPRLILGTRDAIDIYSPGPATAAAYVGTFNYGGCSNSSPVPPCANMYVQLDEIANNEVANSVLLNGSGANPQILSEVFPARIGHTWAARVAVVAPPYPNPDFTILFTSSASFGPFSTPYGELLIDPAQQVRRPRLAEGSYTFAIPADTGLIGRVLFFQAAVLAPAAPSAFLTNALRVRVGY